jgi:hypothetical protein
LLITSIDFHWLLIFAFILLIDFHFHCHWLRWFID